jgi:hypothetical protein
MTCQPRPTIARMLRLRELDEQLLSLMVGSEPRDAAEFQAWSKLVTELKAEIRRLEAETWSASHPPAAAERNSSRRPRARMCALKINRKAERPIEAFGELIADDHHEGQPNYVPTPADFKVYRYPSTRALKSPVHRRQLRVEQRVAETKPPRGH